MRSPRALTSLGGPRSPTQLHRNGSASQGQVGVVDSRLSHWEVFLEGPLDRLDPEEPPVGLELRHHVVRHELLGQYGSRRRPWPPEGPLEHVQHLATLILVLNSVTILNQHLPHGVGETVNVLLEVHYGDREEPGPLEHPVGVAVDPVVLRGSRPPGALWSTVSSMMTA